MPTRKALAYSRRKPVVNTRKSKKQQKSFIKVVPPQKIIKFNMGDYQGFEAGKYKIKMSLSAGQTVQIRDLALEAVRQTIHKDMTKLLTQKNYFFRCNVYPHNILRNNRIFSGGSKGERIQTGMGKSFGTSEGRAAVVRRGHPVFTVYFNGDDNIAKVRHFFSKAKPKLPGKSLIAVEVTK